MATLKSESEVQQLILLEAPKHGCILMRNNSGAYKDETGRMVFYGLGNVSKSRNELIKSSDLIGLIGGRFIAVECKREGWKFKPNDKREQAQVTFINWIGANGGISGFCQSVEDFLRLIGK